MKRFALVLIRFYQKLVSLAIKVFWPAGVCRFTPTCSEYTYQAVNRHGLLVGGTLGVRRVLRCHPYSKGGYDPII